jgi:hypothetical protein
MPGAMNRAATKGLSRYWTVKVPTMSWWMLHWNV